MVENISKKAVFNATGKNWEQWHEILKKEVDNNWSHKEIVNHLRNEYNVSHWWAQTITVDYEVFIGKRQVGQTQTSDFQIGVRRTVDNSLEDVWNLLMSKKASNIWLGKNKVDIFEKGTKYVTLEGTTGEIRVIQPNHHIRLTWKPKDWEKPSTLQIRVNSTQSLKTTIAIHQEKLINQNVREQMRTHWKEVLDQLEKIM